MCVCAYLHNEMLIMEEVEKENKGKTVINDENDFVRNTILSLKSIIEEANYTYENMLLLYTRFPQVKVFYDHVGTIIKKHIKVGEPWIPALVILSVLQEYTLRGYKNFEYIDFTEAIDKFILSKKANSVKYLKVAGDVFDTMVELKHKKPKNKKRRKVK